MSIHHVAEQIFSRGVQFPSFDRRLKERRGTEEGQKPRVCRAGSRRKRRAEMDIGQDDAKEKERAVVY